MVSCGGVCALHNETDSARIGGELIGRFMVHSLCTSNCLSLFFFPTWQPVHSVALPFQLFGNPTTTKNGGLYDSARKTGNQNQTNPSIVVLNFNVLAQIMPLLGEY